MVVKIESRDRDEEAKNFLKNYSWRLVFKVRKTHINDFLVNINGMNGKQLAQFYESYALECIGTQGMVIITEGQVEELANINVTVDQSQVSEMVQVMRNFLN